MDSQTNISKNCNVNAVRALVLSRIDYANSLLHNARSLDLQRLQRLQNKAARLVFACGRDRRSADLLASLHWLPVKNRIYYKLMLYVFKCISGLAPSYLSNLIMLHNSATSEYRHRLRSSSDTTRLWVPRTKKRAGDSSFSAAAPRLWNDLPVPLRESVSVPVFRRVLKTYCFSM